jgi:16S rRNA (cytidine1402-2'-O)-methyltransferase
VTPAGVLVLVGGSLAAGEGVSARASAAGPAAEPAGGVPAVLARLAAGDRVVMAVPPDAPAAARLVAAATAAGHAVEHVPGPSAALAALAVSGQPTARFVVESGLPPAGPERAARLAALAAERRTAVVVAAPEGVAATLTDLAAVCGPDRRAAVVAGPVVWRGRLGEAAVPDTDGRVVVVLAGAPAAAPPSDGDVVAALEAELAAGATARDAARVVAVRLAVPRRRAYALAVGVSNDETIKRRNDK